MIEKSKPQTNYPFVYSDTLNLKTSDIDGSQFGSKNVINKYNSVNSGLLINDVLGAQTSSLKRGIVTVRKTNPLVPNYILPGSKEVTLSDNNPYGKTSTNFKFRTASHLANNNNLPRVNREEIRNATQTLTLPNEVNDIKNIRENAHNESNNKTEKMYSNTEGNNERLLNIL